MEPRQLQFDEIGMVDEVTHQGALAGVAEPGHAVLHVGEEALSGLLAVVADVDSRGVLRGDDVRRGLLDRGTQHVGRHRLATAPPAVHLREPLGSRQTPRVGRENS